MNYKDKIGIALFFLNIFIEALLVKTGLDWHLNIQLGLFQVLALIIIFSVLIYEFRVENFKEDFKVSSEDFLLNNLGKTILLKTSLVFSFIVYLFS